MEEQLHLSNKKIYNDDEINRAKVDTLRPFRPFEWGLVGWL